MTIDEAIAHAREKAKEKRKEMQCKTCKLFARSDLHPLQGYCRKNEFRSIEIDSWSKVCSEYVPKEMCKCAEEYEQLAEWLKLLKWYEQGMKDIPSESGVLPKDVYHAGYNKAIDDFAEKIVINSNRLNVDTDDFEEFGDNVANVVYGLAEQLRAGASNETDNQ